jgi:hypothetical protein
MSFFELKVRYEPLVWSVFSINEKKEIKTFYFDTNIGVDDFYHIFLNNIIRENNYIQHSFSRSISLFECMDFYMDGVKIFTGYSDKVIDVVGVNPGEIYLRFSKKITLHLNNFNKGKKFPLTNCFFTCGCWTDKNDEKNMLQKICKFLNIEEISGIYIKDKDGYLKRVNVYDIYPNCSMFSDEFLVIEKNKDYSLIKKLNWIDDKLYQKKNENEN